MRCPKICIISVTFECIKYAELLYVGGCFRQLISWQNWLIHHTGSWLSFSSLTNRLILTTQ